jgi:hypothetical protein
MAKKYTLAGTVVSIGTTADIDFTTDESALTAFAADTYTRIGGTETISDFGDTASDVTFTGLEDSRTEHLKGSTDGGSIEITCADDTTDAGQIAVLAAASPTDQGEYNIKLEYQNGDTGYLKGPIMGFSRVNGTGPNNVAKRKFSIGNNHGEKLALAAGAGTAPAFTSAPTISGTATVGQTLTAATGTVTGTPTPGKTWQWYRDGLAIPGATGTTYLLVSGDLAKAITVEETATNSAGVARAISEPTDDVAGA